MGTKMAPAYANIFVGSIDETLQNIDVITFTYGNVSLMTSLCSQAQLTTFITQINQVHPTIKFTYEHSNSELTFLDVTVYKGIDFEETGLLDVENT